MNAVELPTGREFRNRLQMVSGLLSAASTLMIALYLFALIRLTPEQWAGFGWIVAGLFPMLFGAQSLGNRKHWTPIVRCLDLRRAGPLERDVLEHGFAAVANFGYRMLVSGLFWWTLGGLLVAVLMRLCFETLVWSAVISMLAASVSGGFVMCVFHFFMVKRMAEPVRNALAAEMGSPEVRQRLVEPVPVRRKLWVSITGVTLVVVLFVIQLAQARSSQPIEARANDLHRRFLAGVAESVTSADAPALETARAEARRLGIADELLLLDARGDAVLSGDSAVLLADEIAELRAVGIAGGDSRNFVSPSVFSWQRAPAGVLVAVSAWEPLRGDVTGVQIEFLGLLLGSTALSGALAWLLAQDVSRATEALRVEAERLSSGDLRRGEVFESEDELGELSRSFETMAGSLRATVRRVSEAADRVEATAGEMAGVSGSVGAVTADQVRGIQQTTTSMEAINQQMRGIADSAQALNVSVEESSSSILELGAAGEELNETASVLSGKVNEVSSSIEQMVRSVKQVLENTEALSEAAVETSASMEEMAMSMREVDVSAEETARLSHQVVASAESGQAKMVQTIEGMEAIREATETAERVIRNLGSRTREIGAIVDVIDDVADETNLLALNAAIIAAQAGEQGKAFSVVADEIKDLADRVLASTKEIGGLIRAVQEEGSNAIGAIERGAASVASGVDLSAEAGVSLEEITRASRESGTRIAGIVSAVREQAKAASHVVELMERVRGGVEQIRNASAEQDRGNEVVHASSVAMREVAQQVRGTTEEQARGSGRIRESVEEVREAVERINSALQEQSAACRSAAEFLEAVYARTKSNQESARRLDEVTQSLLHQAEALRQDVRRFSV
jgi:methyl-accepting chemotaxis protein